MEIEELPSIGTRVLEIARSPGYKEGAFSFNLTFDKTIFTMDTGHWTVLDVEARDARKIS